ncbi:FAD-dependent oxidoreductase [Rhodococcus sp. USK13]|uniref:NAD(P)/FAD-dependent oxidoreductase n=1 Tax=Rhodococcus sp. USK13 TaxID=2806442 RepID=UPI001BCDDA41|nr:FAD-dependent oxidoreductase [Rhodococcus sp. USK13]
MSKIVIVGGSLAAVHAIESLRSNGHDGDIILVGAEKHLPYDRPPLSKEALFSEGGPTPLRPAAWYDEFDVRLHLGRAARGLRPNDRTLVLEDGEEMSYDSLLIATGSRVRHLGSGDKYIHYLRTPEDAASLRDEFGRVKHVVIIGAGLIGMEVAATVSVLGIRVTIIEVAPAPLARVLGDEVGQWFKRLHESHGVTVLCSVLAVDVHADPRGGYLVSTSNDELVRADLVVGALGAAPAVDWLRTSGLDLGDGILCDATLQTNAPGVVAAGDVARWYNPLYDEDMRVQQWVNAVEQGRHAAMTLLGASSPYVAAPYFGSDQFGTKLRFVGRATAADDIRIDEMTNDVLVTTYWRQGSKIGALCVNAAMQLPRHHAEIVDAQLNSPRDFCR